MANLLYVIFDGPPSHESGRFVEVEDSAGQGVGLTGRKWEQRSGGLWSLGPFASESDLLNTHRDALAPIQAIVDAQAEDEGLWGVPLEGTQPITEVYLQQELRRLHAVIEEQTDPDNKVGRTG